MVFISSVMNNATEFNTDAPFPPFKESTSRGNQVTQPTNIDSKNLSYTILASDDEYSKILYEQEHLFLA
ncbi:hypothetical protein [Vibrio diazotrophicus]|uniref:hypothetical protein n=1 Tax=Vibrio diazotrophicus TaxID=685 RepID=UPI0005A6EFDA|nr:hypothetical protein [Vibrio diazotrophicus]